jgi:hypothetical protein
MANHKTKLELTWVCLRRLACAQRASRGFGRQVGKDGTAE